MALLAGAGTWSLWLAWRIAGLSATGTRRVAATAAVGLAVALAVAGWAHLFWG